MVSGRLMHGHGYGREFEHMALVVELEGRKWLIDVGYGDFSLRPLAILPGEVQSDGRTYYQIMDHFLVDGIKYLGIAKWNHSKHAFKTEYIFTLTPRVLQEFSQMNLFHQNSPDSHFARSLICTLPVAEGRISIINNKFIRTGNGRKQVQSIPDSDHRHELLKNHFNIDLSARTRLYNSEPVSARSGK
jgi:N-hydroxyarylamine O-acetyltransferase